MDDDDGLNEYINERLARNLKELTIDNPTIELYIWPKPSLMLISGERSRSESTSLLSNLGLLLWGQLHDLPSRFKATES